MKTIYSIFLASFVTLLFFMSGIVAAAPVTDSSALSGREILDEISKRHDQPYEFETQEVILTDKAGNQEKREMQRYKREISNDETRHLSIFLAPSGVKGVSLLTWQHKAAEDDQWLYLPAYGKEMKRIAKGGKKNYFMGTDYTFEDLVSENRDKFSYERLPDEELNGVKTFAIKAVAADSELQKETGYGFRKLWITQDNFMVAQIEFFDQHERLIKRQRNFEPVNIQGQTW
ncbi:MAG: outer membrane lipoprotein-sorting protein, partial [Gammaproteobacteria bacterium]